MHAAVQRVATRLQELGATHAPIMLEESAHTAEDAARALGCHVAQIAKSLVFRALTSDRAVLVVAAGHHRVAEHRLAALVGEPIGKADAAFVRERTGYPVGGVPPVAHAGTLPTWIDQDLLRQTVLWAAAGHPRAVFRLTPEELVRWTGGRVAAVAE
jgi:prolyl-tRNA editing enzyme YbaK/EbsC (Cys-tRNA(Pro) deacylase)